MTALVGWPTEAGPARDAAILDAIERGRAELTWATITRDVDGHTIELRVLGDALKIEGVRINVSATLQQQIADLLDCSLLTATIADLLWANRSITIPPMTRPITSSTAAMIDNSAKIDAAIQAAGGLGEGGIASTVGKHWILDNLIAQHPGRAINYGWHFAGTFQGQTWDSCATGAGGSGCRVIQGRGWAHDAQEVDYSQTCTLVARPCRIDGQPRDLTDVFADVALARYVAPVPAGTALKVTRMPNVPRPAPAAVSMLPPIAVSPYAAQIAPGAVPSHALLWAGGVGLAAYLAWRFWPRGRRSRR